MTGQFPSKLILMSGLLIFIDGINNAAVTQSQFTMIGADDIGDAVHLMMGSGRFSDRGLNEYAVQDRVYESNLNSGGDVLRKECRKM
jgi:hypothetical protein